MVACASYKPLLSTRNYHVFSTCCFKRSRRRTIFTIKNDSYSFVCIGGVINISFTPAIYGRRNFHSSQLHWISPKAPSLSVQSSRACYNIISFHSNQEAPPPSTLTNLEFRVGELEQSQLQNPTKYDLQNQIWQLLLDCASSPVARPTSDRVVAKNIMQQQELLGRAKLCSRLFELCLKGVEARRVFLWEWLQGVVNDNNSNHNADASSNTNNFSPTAYWNDTPHLPKEMFTIVLSAWKNVIESCSSFSIKSVDAMELMESSAQQASSLLFLMEDEYSSDVAFIDAYNSQVDKGRYSSLVTGATPPDARNYSEVIGTWGQCIDGSALRLPEKRGREKHHPNAPLRDGAFQKRLQLEATAMKSMMKLLESMEEDLYETFGAESTNESSSRRKRPPPDRVCYNIILASMARQANPSLYEMRLVLQRMMERVMYELEHPPNNDTDSGEADDQHAMDFFPDVFSYNALIEARANRSNMFVSDSSTQQQQNPQQFTPTRLQHHAAWQQGQSDNPLQRKKRFSSSEEEALLGEQILDEMDRIITASVRPNIWSYNAVIKAWIKSGSDRGLQRAVMILCSLALNGHNRIDKRDTDGNDSSTSTKAKRGDEDEVPTIFGRIAHWGASLLGRNNEQHRNKSRSTAQTQHNTRRSSFEGNVSSTTNVGMGSRLNYLQSGIQELNEANPRVQQHHTGPSMHNNPPMMSQVPLGMAGRMAMMNSAIQGKYPRSPTASPNSKETDNKELEPIGPLPKIEPNVTPDLRTFTLVINALERRGTAASAKVAGGLLQLLNEYYYFELNPDITIYNCVLNAWAKAAKGSSTGRSGLASAQKADEMLCRLLAKDQEESGMLPQPNEYSFLMTLNAWANAASTAISAGHLRDGRIAAEHADELLKKMQKQMLNTTKTTLACYGAVIRTWASLGFAEQAHAVLLEMVQISGHLQQDLIHFNTVLDAWARDLESAKDLDMVVQRLLSIHDFLLKMNTRGGSFNVDPDTSSFNHVIRACYAPWASSKTHVDESIRRKAFEIAYDTYSMMSQDYGVAHRPDAHTYTHLFKAIACLLPTADADNEKVSTCKTVLQACCRDGHLAKSSIWIIRKMLSSEDEFAELLLSLMDHPGNITKEKLLSIPEDRLFAYLPEEWSRNGRNLNALNRHRQ